MKTRKVSRFAFFGCVAMFGACGDDETNGVTGPADGSVQADGTVQNDGAIAGDGGGEGGHDSGRDSSSDAPRDVLSHDVNVGDAGCVTQAPTLPALKIVPVYDSSVFDFATYAKQPPGSSDWYVVEQGGIIRIVRNGQVLTTPFLDISAGMGTNPDERGLLSIAFHPNYAQNGRFFVMGTPTDNADGSFAPANADAVVEFHRDANNPDIASPTKVRDIVVLDPSDTNHNAGTIQFGPDNFLYVGTGDGGGGCESAKPGTVQDTAELYGKILRLDVDAQPPFAAAGNPFTNDPRVYHYGLRNPFRWNFDSLTGDLYIGDVGQYRYEEISIAVGNSPGKNFGWPAHEGSGQGTCSGKTLGGPSQHTPPIVSADRSGSGPFADYSSIIGGRVYRGTAIPALQGVYLFADYSGGAMGALRHCGGQTYGPVAVQLSQISTPNGSPRNITSFIEGNDGELYLMYSSSRLGRLALQ